MGASGDSWSRSCPRGAGSMTLPDGGTLNPDVVHPTYSPPKLPPSYAGHIPFLQFEYGVSQGKLFDQYFLKEREKEFSNGYSQGPRSQMPARPVLPATFEVPRHRLTYFDPSRKEFYARLNQAIQNHRDKYRDLSGMKKPEPYFIIPRKLEDRYRHLIPINSYYLHKNRRPLPHRPDASWSYVHQMNDVFYHGCRDLSGRLDKRCFKGSYHRRTRDTNLLQPILHGYR